MLSEKEIKQFIDEDNVSLLKQQARKALDYYEGRHDIKDYRVFYFNESGVLEEDTTRSNERISHPFFTENIDQMAQHLLSGKDSYVRSDIPKLQSLLDEYFNDDFKTELYDLLTYTAVEGYGYLYRYADENLRSRFKFADALNVIEVPSKYSSDGKDYTIYYYFYKKEKNREIYKVEVWDKEYVYPFIMVKNKLFSDGKPRHHVLYEEDGAKYYDTFDNIPFIRMDNNRKRTSDLKVIKDLIDDYDLMACGMSNNIQDVAEGIYVIKGYNGNDLSELTYNIKHKKQVAVGEGGDVEIKTINIPYQARAIKLDLDEKNIYRFGFSFDSSKSETANVTNVVIKSRYTLLDMKCNKKEIQLKKVMKRIIKMVVDEINAMNNTAYKESDVYCEFERVTPTNEADNANIKLIEANTAQVQVNTILNLANVLDSDTMLKNICDALDLDFEEIKEKMPQQEEATIDDARELLDEEL